MWLFNDFCISTTIVVYKKSLWFQMLCFNQWSTQVENMRTSYLRSYARCIGGALIIKLSILRPTCPHFWSLIDLKKSTFNMYTMQWLSAHTTFGRAPQPSNLTRVWILLRRAVGACGRAIRAFPRTWLRARQTLNQETQSEHILVGGALQS